MADDREEICPSCGSTDTGCALCDEWNCWECGHVFYVSDCDCFDGGGGDR